MLSFKGKLMENVAEDDHGQSDCKIHENGLDLRQKITSETFAIRTDATAKMIVYVR